MTGKEAFNLMSDVIDQVACELTDKVVVSYEYHNNVSEPYLEIILSNGIFHYKRIIYEYHLQGIHGIASRVISEKLIDDWRSYIRRNDCSGYLRLNFINRKDYDMDIAYDAKMKIKVYLLQHRSYMLGYVRDVEFEECDDGRRTFLRLSDFSGFEVKYLFNKLADEVDLDNIYGDGLKNICDRIIETWNKEVRVRLSTVRSTSKSVSIDKVIHNDPATIVLWSDGTKTVVKCDPTDKFDPEKGLAMAVSKKFLGDNTGKYYDTFKKWIPTGCYMKEKKDTNSKEVVYCGNCVYSDLLLTQEPCYYCNHWSNFIRKGKKK